MGTKTKDEGWGRSKVFLVVVRESKRRWCAEAGGGATYTSLGSPGWRAKGSLEVRSTVYGCSESLKLHMEDIGGSPAKLKQIIRLTVPGSPHHAAGYVPCAHIVDPRRSLHRPAHPKETSASRKAAQMPGMCCPRFPLPLDNSPPQ